MMYIGSKTAKGCLESDLGTKYFSSCKQFNWKDNPESFEICRIIPCASNHDAIILEGLLIEQNGAIWDDDYYNRSVAGKTFNFSGLTKTEEQRILIGLSGKKNKGRIQSDEERELRKITLQKFYSESSERALRVKEFRSDRMVGDKNSFYGKTHSEESRKKISDSNKGKTHTEETKKLLSDMGVGRIPTDETKRKLSESAKNRQPKHCTHCNRYIAPGPYKRFHGDMCKMKRKE